MIFFTIHTGQETDGRWLAEISQIPGALAYGSTRADAIVRAKALGLRVLADQIERGEPSEIERIFKVLGETAKRRIRQSRQ